MLAALRVRRLAVPIASLAVLSATSVSPARAEQYAIHIDHETTAGTLHRVLDRARERLAEPRCQQVLDDFADAHGRSLRDRLAETGRTPEDYLGLVVFYDGRKHPRCAQKGILAVANVGSRVVWVCPDELYTKAGRDPVWAEAALIHEALHTLGLGEDPPSSQEITSRVIRRCRH